MAPIGAGSSAWFRHAILVAASCALTALTPDVAAQAVAAEPSPAAAPEPYNPPENPRELLRLDPVAVQFFQDRVRLRGDTSDSMRQVVDAIVQPDGLHFAYDAEATLDAGETFRRRRGNCVSFSFLVVAAARSLGLEAKFQDLETSPHWDRFGHLVVSVRHMNVRVLGNGFDSIVDLRPDLVPANAIDGAASEPDQRAFAQFYNNVGFFRLLHGQTADALHYLSLATSIDPAFAGAWSNRAQVHARLGDLIAARDCFERALHEEPHGLVALDGLVSVLRQLGSPEDLQRVEKLSRRARALQDQNPYYQQHLALQARDSGDWQEAERLLRRAISLKNDEPEFLEQRIAILQQLGQVADAERAAAKLASLRKRLANASPYLTR